MNELRLLSAEYGKLEAELAEVAEARIEKDADGNQFAVPVHALQGQQRTWREARMRQIGQQMTQVAGIEGQKALDRAAREEALKRRQRSAQIEEQREITRRAHEIAKEKRVGKRPLKRGRATCERSPPFQGVAWQALRTDQSP